MIATALVSRHTLIQNKWKFHLLPSLDCAKALNLDLDCIYCKVRLPCHHRDMIFLIYHVYQGPCWEKSHQMKLKDEIERKNKLVKPMKKKTFLLPQTKNEPKKNLTMENADNVSFLNTQLNAHFAFWGCGSPLHHNGHDPEKKSRAEGAGTEAKMRRIVPQWSQ